MARRLALARATADAFSALGHSPHDGHSYVGLYDTDRTPGVFRDLRGLLVLRRLSMPSVIIETHNAFDARDAERWTDPHTLDEMVSAVTTALVKTLPE